MIWAAVIGLWLAAAFAVTWIFGRLARLGLTEEERRAQDADQATWVHLEGLWRLDAKEGHPPGEERPS